MFVRVFKYHDWYVTQYITYLKAPCFHYQSRTSMNSRSFCKHPPKIKWNDVLCYRQTHGVWFYLFF